MIYVCNNCKFCFERRAEVDQCPDCGKFAVRTANEEEKLEYFKITEENKNI